MTTKTLSSTSAVQLASQVQKFKAMGWQVIDFYDVRRSWWSVSFFCVLAYGQMTDAELQCVVDSLTASDNKIKAAAAALLAAKPNV